MLIGVATNTLWIWVAPINNIRV